MSDNLIKPGLEVVLSVGPVGGLGISSARVLTVGEDCLTLQTDGRLLFVRPGVLLDVRIPDRQKEGWATLLSLDPDDERTPMVISDVRWSDSSRSPRQPADYRVKVSFVEATSEGPKMRQITGYTSNISMTGAKVFVGKELDLAQIYQFEVFLNEAEMPCVAVGKIVRATQGSGAVKDSWELGVRFVRFISGLAEYGKAVGERAFSEQVGNIADSDESEIAEAA